MKYIEQTLDSMLLYVVKRVIDTSIFTVISQSAFKYKNMKVTFGILSESHFITVEIENENIFFNEICACAEFDIDNTKPHIVSEIQNQTITEETTRYTYQFSTTLLGTRQGKRELKALRRKRRNPDTHYLEHTFPTKWMWSRAAVTEVYVTEGDSITMESVHTYPNEEMMIFTESSYTIKK